MKLIYSITNRINNKIYVGKHITTKINDNYFGSGKLIKQAIVKYGKENFIKNIIDEAETIDELNNKEIFWIKQLNTNSPNGYNLCKGGEGMDGNLIRGEKNPFFGKHHSEETRKILKEKAKQRIHIYKTPQFKQKISELTLGEKNPFFGKHHSEETRKKMSDSHKGKASRIGFNLKEETKNQISNTLKKYFKENGCINKGRKLSEETKKKISNTLKNRNK